MSDTPPDRLSVDPSSPHYDEAVLGRGVGIRFNGQERTNIEEYCVSEGWVRVAAGRARDRRAERVAAERTAVIAGPEDAHHLAVGQHGRDRVEPAGERLADGDHVRAHALVIAGEQPAGAAQAGLNLVGDEQDIVLRT